MFRRHDIFAVILKTLAGLNEGGTPVSNTFGGIYTNDGSSVAQNNITTTPTKLLNWDGNYASSGVTPAFGSSQITLDSAGTYAILCQVSFSGTANTTFQIHFALDGVLNENIGTHRRLGAGGDVGSCSFVGIATSNANQVASLLIESDAGGGASATIVDAQFFVFLMA